ncbi:MAG: hypothetical protein P1U35_10620 [Cycloclasticus sp.]|nr:hypothetical protein [Cycloclasticus sp.]
MKQTKEEVFSEAVSLAERIISKYTQRDEHEVSFLFTMLKCTGEQLENKNDTRLHTFDQKSRKYFRIKLYSNESPDTNKVTEKLIEFAKTDRDLFDDLNEIIAYDLRHGNKLHPLILEFLASTLEREIIRPSKRLKSKENFHRGVLAAMEVLSMLYNGRLHLTRNDASTNQLSILDAVSQAAENLGYKCKYATLKRDVYPGRWASKIMKEIEADLNDKTK